jgi:DNA-binding GntR family transcriptional regulator
MAMADEGDRVGKIENLPLHERVYRQIKVALMAGRLSPGEVVTLRGLASELGTSVMPVRDAVRRLASEGALEALPHRAMHVPEVSLKRFAELTEVRAMLEGRAAGLAAERISAEELTRVVEFNDRLTRSIKGRDTETVTTENQQFHFAIYAASRSEVLVSIIEALWLQAGPCIVHMHRHSLNRSDREDLSEVAIANHAAIVHALHARDPQAAEAAMKKDIFDAAAYLRASVETRIAAAS